jgi:hypothetical protein
VFSDVAADHMYGKGKVKLIPVLNYMIKHCHEGMWGSGGIAPLFLTSAPDGGEWSASRPCGLTPGYTARRTHWIGSWVGPRAGVDSMKKRKIYFPCRKSNPSHPAHGLVAIPTELSQLHPMYRKASRNYTLTST